MMLWNTFVKEAKQLSKDKGFLLIAFLQPIIFIVMFGSSFESGDINHLDTIVIDEDMSKYSAYVVDAVNRSEYYDIMPYSGSFEESRDLMHKEKVRGVFRIRKGFGENIENSESGEIDVLVDSSIFLVYLAIMGARGEVVGDTLYNISEGIFDDMEGEREEGEVVITDIRTRLDGIDVRSAELSDKFEEMRETFDTEKIEEDIEDLQDGLGDQEDGMREIRTGISAVQNLIDSIVVVGAEDEVKKNLSISSLEDLDDGLLEVIYANDEIQDGVRDMDVELDVDNYVEELDRMFEDLNASFMIIREKSDDIDFDFDGLQKDFLVEPVIMNTEEMYGETTYFDYLGAGILSLIVFFICLLAPALNVIAEKESNTLYRLSTTPANTSMVFMGKFLLFLVFGIFEMIYTLFLAIVLYDLRITGSLYEVVAILTLLACASIAIGLFVSSKVSTMQQALIIVPVMVIPSFLISNSFFPPDIMPDFMNKISMITPMTFSNHALNNVMIKGFSLSFVWFDLMMLGLFMLIPLGLFIWSFRRIRY